MTGKEFFEKNKGGYFYYEGEKVRVVGYGGTIQPILVSKKEGWYWGSVQSRNVDYIDQTLIYTGDPFWFVDEEELTPIEQSELNLCELLEGCEGMVFYSTMVGDCRLIELTEFITIGYGYDDDYIILESDGKYNVEGECTLFPYKENRDWSTFVRPNKIKDGTPVMCYNAINGLWILRKYYNDFPVYKYIVPATEFDFSDFDSNKSKSII